MIGTFAFLWFALVGTAPTRAPLHIGGEMRVGEATPIAELGLHAERWFNRDVRIEGIIGCVASEDGRFIEVVPDDASGDGVLVTFPDTTTFPLDCIGCRVVVEGMFYQKIYPSSRVARWQEQSFRPGKPVPPFSLLRRITAKSVEIGVERRPLPPPGDIVAGDTGSVDLARMEFEVDGLGTGRKQLAPGEVTPRHSTGRVRELVFCLEGVVQVQLGQAEPVLLKAGEMIYIPPATEHTLSNVSPDRAIYLFVFSMAPEGVEAKGRSN